MLGAIALAPVRECPVEQRANRFRDTVQKEWKQHHRGKSNNTSNSKEHKAGVHKAVYVPAILAGAESTSRESDDLYSPYRNHLLVHDAGRRRRKRPEREPEVGIRVLWRPESRPAAIYQAAQFRTTSPTSCRKVNEKKDAPACNGGQKRVSEMRHVIGLLYLATALVGFYWSIYLTLTGLYGMPFSPWYAVIFVGAVLLLIGAILWWASIREWTRWFPILGNVCLAAYFVPAVIVLIRQGRLDLIRVLIVTLVLASLAVSVKERPVTTYGQVQQR